MYAFANFVSTEMVSSFCFVSSHVFSTVKYIFAPSISWIHKTRSEKFKAEVYTISLKLIEEENWDFVLFGLLFACTVDCKSV